METEKDEVDGKEWEINKNFPVGLKSRVRFSSELLFRMSVVTWEIAQPKSNDCDFDRETITKIWPWRRSGYSLVSSCRQWCIIESFQDLPTNQENSTKKVLWFRVCVTWNMNCRVSKRVPAWVGGWDGGRRGSLSLRRPILGMSEDARYCITGGRIDAVVSQLLH